MNIIKYTEGICGMSVQLLPIGAYDYDKDAYSFDDAWENLERSFQDNRFVVCKAISYSEDKKCIDLDYHNIRGKIYSGYITQNRHICNEFFIEKTLCVKIHYLNKRTRTFTATRIPVEQEAKKQLSLLKRGDRVSGNVIRIGNNSSYAIIDIMEGLTVFISAKNRMWRPLGCHEEPFLMGEHIEGTISFLESPVLPQHDTIGRMTCLDFKRNWEPEIDNLFIGKIVEGFPQLEIMPLDTYCIGLSRHVYVEFYSEEFLPKEEAVQVEITEIDSEKHLIRGILKMKDFSAASGMHTNSDECVSSVSSVIETGGQKNLNGSLFNLEVKATVSPFSLRPHEEKNFESIPNSNTNFSIIRGRIKEGHVGEIHFSILKAINFMVFCTSKQINAYLYCKGILPQNLSRNKLNTKLSSMVKLGLIDRIRFSSDTGTGIYRVYFLNKNGERLLNGYLGTKRTSYNEAMLATPTEEIKRYLATNQIVLAFEEKFTFFRVTRIREILLAAEAVPIRVSARIAFSNSNLLLETQRRYSGWQEKLLEKMDRYAILFQNIHATLLPEKTRFLLHKPLFLLVIAEDIEHALEIRNLLFGHTIYPILFMTYDLLIFQKDINYSVFRFQGIGREITYFNVTDLLKYNILSSVETESSEKKDSEDDVLRVFQKCLANNYFLALDYLQSHSSPQLSAFVSNELQDLYHVADDGSYQTVYPEEEQYYIYLLFKISHHMIPTLTAEFHEGGELLAQSITKNIEDTAENISMMEQSSASVALETAVLLVLKRIEQWLKSKMGVTGQIDAPFEITKHPKGQTSGTQYGYDVGINFRYHNEKFRLCFECKSYTSLQKKHDEGKSSHLSIDRYAYNLLEFFMYCQQTEDIHNFWILVSPFGDLQNNLHENLFEKWNYNIPFMQIHVFSRSQTGITCEEFLSLDATAYRMVYQHEPPVRSANEQDHLMEYIFYSIVRKQELQNSFSNKISMYPFDSNTLPQNVQMPLRTPEGENIVEQIFQKLDNNQSVFLIGEYGSGKTFMTYHIVRTILEHQDIYTYYPLWFQLGNQSFPLTRDNIAEAAKVFVKEGLNQYKNLPSDLTMGGRWKILIILDGLDEILSGLSEGTLKIQLLEQICQNFVRIYYSPILFVISSREIDFKSVTSQLHSSISFDRFAKIWIGDCLVEDAIEKLHMVERQVAPDQDNLEHSLTLDSNLMSIARKPLYFGFLREIIVERQWGNKYQDEVDIINAIILRSVQYYQKSNSGWTEAKILQMLHSWAQAITIQLTRGEKPEMSVFGLDFAIPAGAQKNVIRLRRITDVEYRLQFYHNAIREFLVADNLYQEARSCILHQDFSGGKLPEWLNELGLTPVMMDFFRKLIERDYLYMPRIIDLLVGILQSANRYSLQRLGTNLFTLLCFLRGELANLDLQGIFTNNLYLWKCSLRDLNLQNSYMHNLQLFDVNMDNVDLRGADLTGLVMGQDDEICDIHHLKQGEGFRIYVLYSNAHLVEYYFPDRTDLKTYKIFHHAQLEEQGYTSFYPLNDNILFYSEKEVAFENIPEKVFQLPQNCHLLRLDISSIVVEQDRRFELILHNRRYNILLLRQLTQEESQTILVLNHKTYLYVDDHKLLLQWDNACHIVTNLNSTFECFTAIQDVSDKIINIYIKYSDDIQVIRYRLETQETDYSSVKLLEHASFQRVNAILENLLYGISGQSGFLLDLTTPEIQPHKLQIRAKCKDLILENQDTTRRVLGNTEYQMLRNACEI